MSNLSTGQLNELLKVAEKASVAEHVEGCGCCRQVMRDFNKTFTPAKARAILRQLIEKREECERLRNTSRLSLIDNCNECDPCINHLS